MDIKKKIWEKQKQKNRFEKLVVDPKKKWDWVENWNQQHPYECERKKNDGYANRYVLLQAKRIERKKKTKLNETQKTRKKTKKIGRGNIREMLT